MFNINEIFYFDQAIEKTVATMAAPVARYAAPLFCLVAALTWVGIWSQISLTGWQTVAVVVTLVVVSFYAKRARFINLLAAALAMLGLTSVFPSVTFVAVTGASCSVVWALQWVTYVNPVGSVITWALHSSTFATVLTATGAGSAFFGAVVFGILEERVELTSLNPVGKVRAASCKFNNYNSVAEVEAIKAIEANFILSVLFLI